MGEYFAKQNTRYAAIYASPLKRAASTAQALYDAHSEPKPTFTKSLLIREQHFGIGEGKPWTFNGDEYVLHFAFIGSVLWFSELSLSSNLTLEEQFARGIFPVLKGDDERFPGGESLNDLGRFLSLQLIHTTCSHDPRYMWIRRTRQPSDIRSHSSTRSNRRPRRSHKHPCRRRQPWSLHRETCGAVASEGQRDTADRRLQGLVEHSLDTGRNSG